MLSSFEGERKKSFVFFLGTCYTCLCLYVGNYFLFSKLGFLKIMEHFG